MFPIIINQTIQLIPLKNAKSNLLLEFFKKADHDFFELMPQRSDDFYTFSYWDQIIKKSKEYFNAKQSASFVLVEGEKAIGWINFSNVIHGAFKACFLGYTRSFALSNLII